MTDVTNNNNKMIDEEEEEESDEDLDLKQVAETQQPSPQPNVKQHISKKKKSIENSISIASVMEEIC